MKTSPAPIGLALSQEKASLGAFAREGLIGAVVLCLWLAAMLLFVDNAGEKLINHWPIVLVAFFAAAAANATAVGGGFIFLPFFSFFYGIGALESLKLALSSQAFGMSSGAINWCSRLLPISCVLGACGASAVGMILGTYFLLPNDSSIHFLFAWASMLVGIALLIECLLFNKGPREARPTTKTQRVVFALCCAVGGLITAWVSIGIGEIVALWLFFVWRFPITQAVASGVVVLAFCSVLGFIFHSGLGGIPWHYLIFTIPGVILGGRIGAIAGTHIAGSSCDHAPGVKLKMLVATVIFLDGCVVLYFVP